MAFEAFIVDLDGTLWDSFPWYADTLAELSSQERELIYQKLKGGENIMNLVSENGITRGKFLSACEDRVDRLQLYPNVAQTLDTLNSSGISIGICTSLPNQLANSICAVKELSKFFSAFETAKRGRPPKPNPHGILDVLRVLDIPPTPTVAYVGDLPIDARAAYSAGISFIWARYGYGELTDEPRTAEIASISELVSL